MLGEKMFSFSMCFLLVRTPSLHQHNQQQQQQLQLAVQNKTNRVAMMSANLTASGMAIVPAGMGGTCNAVALATTSPWTAPFVGQKDKKSVPLNAKRRCKH